MQKIKKYSTKLLSLLKQMVSYMLYTPTSEDKSAISEPAMQPDIPLSNTFHQSITTLPYNRFIQIITTGKLYPLIISGYLENEALMNAWAVIQAEYSDAVKTPKSESIFMLGKKILNNRWQISLVDMCIYILKREYCSVSAGALADLGYPLVENIDDREQYLTQVYAIETEAKMLIILQNSNVVISSARIK